MIILKRHTYFTSDYGGFFILLACLFSFSFNNLWLNEYHFLLGSIPFYFLAASLVFTKIIVDESDIRFLLAFLFYIAFSVIVKNLFLHQLITIKPFKGFFNLIFIFLIIQHVSFKVKNDHEFMIRAYKFLLYSTYFVLLTSAFDIYAISTGSMQSSLFENQYFRTGQPYNVSRLRGFTQEPSYFGMVLSVLYPVLLSNTLKNRNFVNFLAVIAFWICLLFTLSKVGIITCLIMTLIIVPRSMLLQMLFLLAFVAPVAYFLGFDKVIDANYSYLSQWKIGSNSIGAVGAVGNIGQVDNSTVIRVGHIVSSFKLWMDNFLMGVGFNQSGFYLSQYYPKWMMLSSETNKWAQLSNVGGTPSFSFIPKILSELGFFGLILVLYRLYPFIKKIEAYWIDDYYIRVFSYSFLGFLISSFGVEGYLYLPAWIVFGVLVGLVRSRDATIKSK